MQPPCFEVEALVEGTTMEDVVRVYREVVEVSLVRAVLARLRWAVRAELLGTRPRRRLCFSSKEDTGVDTTPELVSEPGAVVEVLLPVVAVIAVSMDGDGLLVLVDEDARVVVVRMLGMAMDMAGQKVVMLSLEDMGTGRGAVLLITVASMAATEMVLSGSGEVVPMVLFSRRPFLQFWGCNLLWFSSRCRLVLRRSQLLGAQT